MRQLRNILLIAGLLAVLAAAPHVLSPFYVRVGLSMFLAGALAVCWYMLGGLAAYYSFGHTAFVGIGAFAAGLLLPHIGVQNGMLQLSLGLLLGGAVAGLFAAVVAWPILRLRGHYFTIGMLAVALVCGELVSTVAIFKGATGLSLPAVAPASIRVEAFFYWAALATLAVVTLIAWLLASSKIGYGLYSIREDEDAAQMLGVPTTQIKVTAFIVSATLTGLVGALYAFNLGYITTDSVFRGALSLDMIVNSLVGGMGSLAGPILGAAAMTLLTKVLLSDMLEYHLAITGMIVVLVVLLAPDGFTGFVARLRRRQRERAAEGAS